MTEDKSTPGARAVTRFARRLRALWRDDEGPTAVEYAIMLSLITGACMGAISALSDSTQQSFNQSAQAISDAIGP